MILVVCPNLAVDITLHVDALRPGEVHRTAQSSKQAGGKGVNVARALRGLGEEPLVLGLSGGIAGEAIRRGLAREGIESDLVPFEGESRTCVIVLEKDGTATVVNEAGLETDDRGELLRRFQTHLPEAEAVALMGSVPPGVSVEIFDVMARMCRERETFCLLDTSGAALEVGLRGRPSVAKPNRGEAESLLGSSLDSDDDRRDALHMIRALGAEMVILTFGSEGIWLADGRVSARCSMPPTNLRLGNPTGAGDALAAGVIVGRVRSYSIADLARFAVATATASLAEGYGRIRARDLRPEAARFESLSVG
ncbi:MAG TPA: 1-phosphofructokinase family hexose kinase [Vicinamibacteria bacterium]|nr:1-phosphofructokinase family hexose kinase [Vicinamibacteria bacterium]